MRETDKHVRTYLAELLADLGREIEAMERRLAQPAIRERELAGLHAFDLQLLKDIPRLQSRVLVVAEAAARDQGFSEALQATEAAVRQFERTVDERDRLARGL